MNEFNDLLYVQETDPLRFREGATPAILEFPVNKATAPFLVSSSRSTIWINRSKNGKVRAAVRNAEAYGNYFSEVVEAVSEMGIMAEWGNVHPFTKEGVKAAIDHVRFYEIPDLEILASPDNDWTKVDETLEDNTPMLMMFGVPVQYAAWMPPNCIVVVPKDRHFVGFLYGIGERMVSVVHNASRGLAVARDAAAEPGEVPLAPPEGVAAEVGAVAE